MSNFDVFSLSPFYSGYKKEENLLDKSKRQIFMGLRLFIKEIVEFSFRPLKGMILWKM